VTGTIAGHVVRRARAGDARGCARVYVDAWRDAYAGLVPDRALLAMSRERQERYWAAAIADGNRQTLRGAVHVAEADGGIVGVTSFGVSRKPDFGYRGEVFTLYVAGDHQGLGIGRDLLRRGLAGLRDAGCVPAFVWVLSGNPSRFFYDAMGGTKVAEKREELWGALLDQEAWGWPDPAAFLDRDGPCSTR